MKTCPACATKVHDDAVGCPQCGGRWSEDGSFQATPEVVTAPEVATAALEGDPCPVCGEPLGAGVRSEGWCSRCGSQLLQNRQTGLWVAVGSTGGTPGVGIAGFVVGLISLVVSLIPLVAIVAVPGSITAAVLSGIGMSQASRRHASRGLAIAGLVMSLIALGIAIIEVAVFDAVFSTASSG